MKECVGLMELKKQRLRLIKERYRELILKRRHEQEKQLALLYDWDDEPDILDDATLARELRRINGDDEE